MNYRWLVNKLDWVTSGELQQVRWQFKEIVDIVCEGNANRFKSIQHLEKNCIWSFRLGYWNK